MIGLRVDIDTIRDIRTLPATLDLLEKYGVRASIFITTGVDETFRNYRHYLNPLKLFSKNMPKRYGRDMFSGLLRKKEVQHSKGIDMITEKGHELGLHGYDHFNWMNHLDNKKKEEISHWIAKGCELFENSLGFHPECFAAPGFKTNPDFLGVLDDFSFWYSSDFTGEKTFYPDMNGKKARTLQVPVSLAIGEHDDKTAIRMLEQQVESGYAVFYIHPSSEPLFRKELMEKALDIIKDDALPLGEQI